MPVVLVHHKPKVDEVEIECLRVHLPGIVAAVLSIRGCPETCVTERDIFLRFMPLGKLDRVDNDVEIHVCASDYPTRVGLKNKLAEEIWKRVDQYLVNLKLGVWVTLVKEGWKEGQTSMWRQVSP